MFEAKRGESLEIEEELLNKFTLNDDTESLDIMKETDGLLISTIHFRTSCIDEGYRILEVYPVFHHGWDCDEWGAIATKDGKTYLIETDHGGLRPKEVTSLAGRLLEFFSRKR